MKDIFFEIFSLLFLYLGAFPTLIKMEFNNELLDTTKYVGKYTSQTYFIKNNTAICSIDVNSINESKLHLYRKVRQIPLFSLHYLVSESYKNVITNHKITLLLHVIDGLVPDTIIEQMKDEIKVKYNPCNADGSVRNVGNYLPKCYYLCNNYFFSYNDNFSCEILQLLKNNQFGFLEVVADTRNWYSHFSADDKKAKRLRDGIDIVIHFEIIYYAIRLYLAKEIKVAVCEDWIIEFFYCIHDYILEVIYEKNAPLKSKTYRISKGFEDVYARLFQVAQQETDGITSNTDL